MILAKMFVDTSEGVVIIVRREEFPVMSCRRLSSGPNDFLAASWESGDLQKTAAEGLRYTVLEIYNSARHLAGHVDVFQAANL